MTPSAVHAFVAPALDGPPTGGTLYNARLIDALRRNGVDCRHVELAALRATPDAHADVLWVDSLYLDAFPELRARAGGARLHLVLHYLPSFVTHGREVARAELDEIERRAIDGADALLVTSPSMQAAVAHLAASPRPLLCVEPGVDVADVSPVDVPPDAARVHAPDGEVAGVMLCNLVAGKGVLPLLRALARTATAGDRFSLAIAGSLELDRAYAAACAELVAAEPQLARRVRLLGPLEHARALVALRDADVLLSASRMEAYGMALAEARALGVPIVARAGGHAAAHVNAASGGELVADEAAVAARFLALARDPQLLAERRQRAAAGARARTWKQAAAEWIAQVEALR